MCSLIDMPTVFDNFCNRFNRVAAVFAPATVDSLICRLMSLSIRNNTGNISFFMNVAFTFSRFNPFTNAKSRILSDTLSIKKHANDS